jgi:hypothetical protein
MEALFVDEEHDMLGKVPKQKYECLYSVRL